MLGHVGKLYGNEKVGNFFDEGHEGKWKQKKKGK